MAKSSSSTDRPFDRETDVIVIGIGAAGTAAAIAAHDAGAEVLIIEKMPKGKEGGNTRVSGGIFFENTNPERAATYLRNLCGEYPVPDDVIDVWARETYENPAWVESLGVTVAPHADFQPEYPELDGSDAYGGYLGVDGIMGGGLLFDALMSAVESRDIEVLLDTPANELVVDAETGAIVGVDATHAGSPLRVRARRGVVVATGGFENNPEMVRDYLRLESPAVWGSPAGTGDGIKMAQKVGADLWHMDNMMSFLGIKVPGHDSAFPIMFAFAMGYVFVGYDGRRIVDETVRTGHGHAYMNGSYELFPTKPMHVVFDETTRLAGPVGSTTPVLPVGWNLLIEGYEWSADNSVEIEKGWIKKGDTIEELAVQLDVDPSTLADTIGRYNTSCAKGEDDQFGRNPLTLTALDDGPYYGFTWGPVIGWSNGGPRRNADSQVLDAFGNVIAGLYAAGNVSSTYSWCKDGGFHIADALAFGRVAGRNAAAESDRSQ